MVVVVDCTGALGYHYPRLLEATLLPLIDKNFGPPHKFALKFNVVLCGSSASSHHSFRIRASPVCFDLKTAESMLRRVVCHGGGSSRALIGAGLDKVLDTKHNCHVFLALDQVFHQI